MGLMGQGILNIFMTLAMYCQINLKKESISINAVLTECSCFLISLPVLYY